MLEVMESSYKSAQDSPSRQLLWELGQLQLNDQQTFYEQLDRDAEERQAAQRQALEAAALEHEKIRQRAEFEREKLELELQLEKEIRRQNELQELEKIRRDKAQQALAVERQRLEAIRAAEEAERRAAEERRAVAAAAAAAEQARIERERTEAEEARRVQEQRAAAQRASEEAESRAKAAAQAARSAQQSLPSSTAPVSQAQSKPQTTITAPTPVQAVTTDTQREREHAGYLQIHKKLKQLRKHVVEQAKQIPQLKTFVGDSRRAIRKKVGQLLADADAEGKKSNRLRTKEVVDILKNAMALEQPQINYADYLVTPLTGTSNTNGPIVLLYLLNIFAKAIINQYINESSVTPKSADPVGVMASSVFAQPDFLFHGASLFDILLAKYHVVCPVVFGVYGPESTPTGRLRLGWKQEQGTFVVEQRHNERMVGLGAGFASIALRNYEKSNNRNPYPPYHFWQAMAAITNVPPNEVTATHVTVLKAIIENHEKRILDAFGDAGVVALRWALVEFPNKIDVRPNVASQALRTAVAGLKILPEEIAKKKKLYL